MKRTIITLLLLLFLIYVQAHESNQSYKFRLYLNEKGNSEYNINEPERFLSPQSIERKRRQNISIDERDLPISNDYFNLIAVAGGKVISHSKWFSTMVIQLNDSSQIDSFTNLSFVDSAKYIWRGTDRINKQIARPRLQSVPPIEIVNIDSINGKAEAQFELHNAKNIYKAGYLGNGINIGVIDAGFTNVDVIPYFATSNIVTYKSFVPSGEVLMDSDHGTRVFSTISAFVPGQMMGSAPNANFYLLHSEDVSSEFPVEEDYWVRAVEFADSVGVDVINSSLGYNSFDDNNLNYTHDVLDGRSSIMSLAADMAFDKGMIVVTSAGNEGNKSWQKISVPGDAAKALTVGAVSSSGEIASFSSRGYTADNRLKPDVVSVGQGTITIDMNGKIGKANGTSFSSPFMAGLVSALWSINPDLDRGELLDIIRESSNRFHNPDSVYGNGVVDIDLAMSKVLNSISSFEDRYEDDTYTVVKVDDEYIDIQIKDDKYRSGEYFFNIIDESGRVILKQSADSERTNIHIGEGLKGDNNSLFVLLKSPKINKTVRINI